MKYAGVKEVLMVILCFSGECNHAKSIRDSQCNFLSDDRPPHDSADDNCVVDSFYARGVFPQNLVGHAPFHGTFQ